MEKESNNQDINAKTKNTSPKILNKTKQKILMAKMYDDMITASYTLENNELNREKVNGQSYSFSKGK